jgi:hypothetical protein
MAKYFSFIFLVTFISISPLNSTAKDKINSKSIKSIEKEGFEEISEILKQMTPEQLEDIQNKADAMMNEIEDMTPKEIEELKQQLHEASSSLDIKNINVKKIDTKQDLKLDKIQGDMKKLKQQKQ